MRSLVVFIFIVFAVFACCSLPSFSQQPYVVTAEPSLFEGSVQGHVYVDGTNESVPGAKVSLINATKDNTTYGSVVADKGGYYYFVKVMPLGNDSYRLKAQEGNETGLSPAFGVASLENKTVDVFLRMSPAGINITFSRDYIVANGGDHVEVIARIVDSGGRPVSPGYEVTFTADGYPPGSSHGAIWPKRAVTDNSGTATAEYGWVPEVGASSMGTIRAQAGVNASSRGAIAIRTKDTTPPVTELTTEGETDNAGGFISDVTCTLTASDPGGWGVNRTYYRIDEAGWQPYQGPFKITGEGGTTVYYYSTDLAGNVEKKKLRTVVIHKK